MRDATDNLIRRAKAGDSTAFDELMMLHEKTVYTLALRITRNPEDALDLSQETFLRVWQALETFRENSSFSTWLYRICYNLCIDHVRRQKREQNVVSLSPDEENGRDYEPAIPDRGPTPEEALERKELAARYTAALETLSEDSRTVLVLRDVNGLSYEEIGEITGATAGTVKSRINRARAKMASLLREYRESS